MKRLLNQLLIISFFTLYIVSSFQPAPVKLTFLKTSSELYAFEGRREWNSGGRSYGRGPPPSGGRGGRYGGGYRSGPPRRQDPHEKLRFKETIKIDPESKTSVADMPFSVATRRVLEEKGFTAMTPVQSQSYDRVFSGADVVARSRTGTGKTFAFGLPLIEKVVSMGLNARRSGREGLPLILVLEPTRELALQVAQELGSVCAAHRMRVQAIFGGVSFTMQERAIRAGVHILVATPGRALDHISRGTVDLSSVAHVVLDEGDTMLEMGFQKDVENIILNVKSPGEEARKVAARSLSDEDDRRDDREEWSDEDDILPYLEDGEDEDGNALSSKPLPAAKRDVQMLLFSATMPGWICSLTEKHMKHPVFLDAVQEGETRLSKTITHYAVPLPPSGNRLESVSACVEDLILTKGAGGQTIIFTNTKEEADTLMTTNCLGTLKSQVLHGDIGQGSRQITIRQFKEGQIDVLVATDVAARGLDIAGVDLVIHTGTPNDADTYVHRSGRTGRAGRKGSSVMLFTPSDERRLRIFENELNFKFQRIGPPGPQEIIEASAVAASKKMESITPLLAKQFIPHARRIVRGYLKDQHVALRDENDIVDSDLEDDEDFDDGESDGAVLKGEENVDEAENEDEDIVEEEEEEEISQYSATEVEEIVARALAAISNRNVITARSVLTGQRDVITLQFDAMFKNGSTPLTNRDWQRLIAGVLRRSFGVEDIKFLKMSMARNEKRNLCALVDVSYENGMDVLDAMETVDLPSGVAIKQCTMLPQLVTERDYSSYSPRSSYGSSGSSSYDGRSSPGSWTPRGSSNFGGRSYSGSSSYRQHGRTDRGGR